MIEDAIKAQALGLGFDLVGITGTGPITAESASHFDGWLADGRAGTMAYLEKHATLRRDSRLPFDGAVSAIVVAMDYGGREPSGPVARYARGDDYHDLMRDRLDQLHKWIEAQCGRPVAGRGYVDSGPVLERDLARRAGLGWFGKNTMLINPERGSFFFLGALFVDLELRVDAPFEADRCGTCTRCMDACPTGAITAPRALDATRCISYLTIELRGPIAESLREAVGGLIYGCDICQEVCPWNERFAAPLREPAFRPREVVASSDAQTIARQLLALDDATYASTFKGSPMKRAKRAGLARNAAVVLGNVGTMDDLSPLQQAAVGDDPIVAESATWAIDRIRRRLAPV